MKIKLSKDESLLSALQRNGVFIDAPCGGNGKCGKCKIKINQADGINPPVKVENEILTQRELDSGVRLACCVYCDGEVDYSLEAVDYKDGKALSFAPVKADLSFGAGMAIDIGTTTVAAYFYDLSDGSLLQTISGLNAQRSFGADVISRIEAYGEGGDLLKQAIINQLNGFIDQFRGSHSLDLTDIVIVGNTVMLHLLSGLDPSSIAVAPFTPLSLFGNSISASVLGLNADCNVYLGDCIASYVGADITAGLLACNADCWDKPKLYIDIGTNGEMAIGDKSGIVCCATAAGPAFEGAHIKQGVGGISGAVSKVFVTDGRLDYSTIGNQKPIGICGSGIIDAIACFLELGLIDETGRIDDSIESGELEIGDGIAVNGSDICEIQLAKAAIAAGINTLLNHSGRRLDEIDEIIVAGGFGSFIDIKSAQAIGLLPQGVKISSVGNAAGSGASSVLLSKSKREALKSLCNKMEYFELSGDSYFQNEYIEQMLFGEE